MADKAPDDDELVMSLVEGALARPSSQRAAYIESACAGDAELSSLVQGYVESEERMQGFLLEPLFREAPPENEHPFEPGEILEGRFRVVREVAEGGMGIVYEAIDEKLERRIAIKCAKAGFDTRLPPEVRHASDISHPNVCKIFEIHTASKREGEIDFITMEFLDGETLAERLRRGLLSREEGRSIARQISAGLAEAHGKQVIHGDLKSSNIILTTSADGAVRAVITDFGLARRPTSTLTSIQSGLRGGTPEYMAPELWEGEKASPASDVYALGVILYELGGGRERGLRKRLPLHKSWEPIVDRCLDPDPARRFRDAAGVAQALSPSSSRRWFLAAAAAAILAAVTGVVTYQRAAGPKESWRLAMLPIQSDAETGNLAGRLSRDVANRLAGLKGGETARLRVIPFDSIESRHIDTVEKAAATLEATHVLRITMVKQPDGKLVLRCVLTDARTMVDGEQWTAEYAPAEIRYVPVALGGFVTSQLGLPPLAAARMRPAAVQDYRNGLSNLRRNSTVDAALPQLQRAVAEDAESPLTFAGLALAQQWKFFLTKDRAWLDRANESEREAQRRNPDVAEVHHAAALLDVREGLYELAVPECQRAIVLDPNDGEAHRVLGQAYDSANRLEEALGEYRKAVEVDPADYRNHQQLGWFVHQQADYPQALPHLLEAVKLARDEPAPHYVLALDYETLGQLRDAESELRLAIHLGETADDWASLGAVLMEEERYAEAVDSMLRAVNFAPERSLWWMNLGTAYHLMGSGAKSERAYRRGLDLAGQDLARDPRDARTRSHLAFVCARLGDSTRAGSEIAQALALKAKDAEVRFMAVATYEALNQRENSLELLRTFSQAELADVQRWPDLADLSHDSRFLKLWQSHQPK